MYFNSCTRFSLFLTARLAACSARRVLEEKKLYKQLLKSAHRVGQVFHIIQVHVHLWAFFPWWGRIVNCAEPYGLEQACTRLPIRLCVKSAAAASSRSTGARKAVTSAQRITTALWVLRPLDYTGIHVCAPERYSVCVVTENPVSSEPWCESHPVSKWCFLSRGQLGSRLLYGNFLPKIRGHVWTGACHYCSASYWRRRWVAVLKISNK